MDAMNDYLAWSQAQHTFVFEAEANLQILNIDMVHFKRFVVRALIAFQIQTG